MVLLAKVVVTWPVHPLLERYDETVGQLWIPVGELVKTLFLERFTEFIQPVLRLPTGHLRGREFSKLSSVSDRDIDKTN